jgi:spermidine synthase
VIASSRFLALLGVFFASGASGLVYEVAWVRGFGLALGNTIWSASLVTAAYMAGLGAGAWLAGARADRVQRTDARAPLRLYAWCEIAIAALGLALLVALPSFEAISPAISSYVVDARGWHELSFGSHALRFALAAVVLLPATLAMGATLSLLARHVVRHDVTQAGWRIGLLYGVNTAGAASGALFVDLVGIPRFGVAGAQLFAVALNGLAVLAALALVRGEPAHLPSRSGPPEPVRDGPAGRGLAFAALALVLGGFAGLGMEIAWFRFLTSALGQYREVFSILLATVLLGIWLGAALASAVTRRGASPGLWLAVAQLAFAGLSAVGLAWFDVSRVRASVGDLLELGAIGAVSEFALLAWSAAQVVLAPALCMGFGFPLANALAQTSAGSVGARAGVLYLANTLGAVAGSLATGFVLLPWLGLRWSAVVLAAIAISAAGAAVVADWARIRSSSGRVQTLRAALLLPFGLVWLVGSSDSDLLLRSFRASDAVGPLLRPPWLVATSEGVLESIVVLDVPEQGRTLYTNGHSMSGTHPLAQRYMRAFAHLPLLQLDGPSNALVICFGVGTTAHAASLHDSLRSLEIVDLSRHVLEHAHFFADSNHGVLDDPRVRVFVNDGRQHLRMREPASYDLVTLEPPPIGFAGVASLYSREFYALARSRLRAGGFASQWLPVRELPAPVIKSMVRAFLDVFPATVLLNGSGGDFVLIGRNAESVELDPVALARRLDARVAVRADLERVEFGSLLEIAGAFAADAGHLDRVTRASPPVTDDAPLTEYAAVYFRAEGAPSDLFDASRAAAWCPRCFDAAAPIAALADLPIYLRLMDSVYRWAAAPEAARALSERPPAWSGGIASADGRRVLRGSRYLQRMIRER